MLKLNNVCKTFSIGTQNEHKALDGLNLSLENGEFVTVIGTNGAGKSSLFNAIGGTFYPERGSIKLDGENITFMKEHKRASMIGRLFQDPLKGTAPNMTIEENLALSYSRRHSGAFRKAVIKEDIDLFYEELKTFDMGLEDRMKMKVGLLSGGQRQALSLLMTTLAKPKLLLLDEHTAALDPYAAEKIMEITNHIQKRDKLTCMMITHNIKSALVSGDRTIMLEAGKVILDVGTDERKNMTIEQLMDLYEKKSQKKLADDRMLLV